MFQSNKNNRPSRRFASHAVKKLILLPAVIGGLALCLCSCEEDTPTPPVSYVTDTEPVGAGLAVIGFAMVGAAVVLVLGRLLR